MKSSTRFTFLIFNNNCVQHSRGLATRNMPRGVKKENLPIKICVSCQRPFNWRKKWERCWDEVTTCSKSCNSKRKIVNKASNLTDMDPLPTPVVGIVNCSDDKRLEKQMLAPTETSENNEEGGVEIKDREGEAPCKGSSEDFELDLKGAKKAAKKELKAERRAKRMGSEDSIQGKKTCDICVKNVDLLIRCRVDETKKWKMVCGKCWHDVSGGQVDGDSLHPFYTYGGLWKNRK